VTRKKKMKSTTTTITTVPSDGPSSISDGGGAGVVVSVGGGTATSGEAAAGSSFPLPNSIVVTSTPDERVTVSVRKVASRPARDCVCVEAEREQWVWNAVAVTRDMLLFLVPSRSI
jgi:hypothetical protein